MMILSLKKNVNNRTVIIWLATLTILPVVPKSDRVTDRKSRSVKRLNEFTAALWPIPMVTFVPIGFRYDRTLLIWQVSISRSNIFVCLYSATFFPSIIISLFWTVCNQLLAFKFLLNLRVEGGCPPFGQHPNLISCSLSGGFVVEWSTLGCE